MIWRVVASMAIQIHCLFAFFCTKLHISSASASRRDSSDLGGPGWELGMQVIGTGRKAFHHKVQEPRETDAHGTADPTEGDALAQQLFDLPALLGRNAPVEGASP